MSGPHARLLVYSDRTVTKVSTTLVSENSRVFLHNNKILEIEFLLCHLRYLGLLYIQKLTTIHSIQKCL